MRLYQIICEATPGQLLKKTGMPEQLEQTWFQKYQEQIPAVDIMNKLISLAPPSNVNTYIEWLTKLFLKDPSFDVNNDNIKTILQGHHNNRQHMEIKDPLRYQSLQQMIDDIVRYEESNQKSILQKTKKKEAGKSGITGPGVKTIIPGKMYQLDQKAAEKYGADTWCISDPRASPEKHAKLFNGYSDNGEEPFFMLTIPELDPKYSKIGVFPGESGDGEFQDVQNNKIPNYNIRQIWKSYPEILEQMEPYIYDEEWLPLEEMTKEEVLSHTGQSPAFYFNYILELGGERWPEIEKTLLTDAGVSVDYATQVMGERWPELEKLLLSQLESYADEAIKYASVFFKGKGWPELEKRLLSDPDLLSYSGKYIDEVYGKRMPEIEQYLLSEAKSNPGTYSWAFVTYANHVIKGRWPEAEPYVLENPYAASNYALDVIKGRWPEAEQAILKDKNAQVMLDYATRVIKGRWPEAESEIMKDSWCSRQYKEEFNL